MARITRQQFMLQLNALRSEHPVWGNKIQELVEAYEADQMTFEELSELVEDYRRQLENDASISEVGTRTRTEVCLEMLFNLAKAVV